MKISSSEDPNYTGVDFNKNLDSCSLGRSCSPASLGNYHKEKTCSSQDQDHSTDFHGVFNFDATSRSMEDIEVESDGKAPFFNMPNCSSSVDEVAEDGCETDSLNSKAIISWLPWRILGSFLATTKNSQLTRYRMWQEENKRRI